MSDAAPSLVSPGATVGGHFRVDRLIGRGGMGEVYAARNLKTGRDVALKLIRPVGEKSSEATRRFLREARAATAIAHPNVIEVFDVFEDTDGTPVMVMELLKGEPFAALRKRVGALKLHEIAKILVPVMDALAAAHAKGIVHRDLKPDNIFLAENARGERFPKVLDFGIAKVLDPAGVLSETQGQHTSTGSILGTPHYMSFEQAMSEKAVDHRTDVWAMGVILFEALCGRRPIEFENLGQMYAAFLQGTTPLVQSCVPDLPTDVAAAIDACLQKRPEQRVDSLVPLRNALAKYLNPSTPGANTGGIVISSIPVGSMGGLSASVPAKPARSRARLVGAGLVVGVATTAAVLAVGVPRRVPATIASEPSAPPSTTAVHAVAATAAPPVGPMVTAAVRDASPAPATLSAPAPTTHAIISKPKPRASASASATPSAPPSAHGIVETLPY